MLKIASFKRNCQITNFTVKLVYKKPKNAKLPNYSFTFIQCDICQKAQNFLPVNYQVDLCRF